MCIKQNILSGAYNVGSGKSYENEKIMEIVYSILSKKQKILIKKNNPVFLKSKKINKNFYADIRKICKLFNWKPKININQGISIILNGK